MPVSAFAVLLGLSSLVGVAVTLGLAAILAYFLRDWRRDRRDRHRNAAIAKARREVQLRELAIKERKAAEAAKNDKFFLKYEEYWDGTG